MAVPEAEMTASEPRRAESLPGDTVTVLSPHLDDAALSLGATLARATASGANVSVVTPFAGPTTSEAPAGWWDRACGFKTEGEAARRRRDEDMAACSIIGARPVWL